MSLTVQEHEVGKASPGRIGEPVSPVGPPRVVAFNRSAVSAAGAAAVADALASGALKANGPSTARCESSLRRALGCEGVVMTQSCTAALELAVLLLGIGPGDEVVMPSFGFASPANVVVLRGATPVFADVLPDTLNLDPESVRQALSARTRAVIAIHYAGVAADIEALLQLTSDHGVALIEDAAHAVGASYRGRPLGTFGTFGALSFDATKNLSSGSGGALIVNDPQMVAPAERLRDYGTDRAQFLRGEVARYRWTVPGQNAAMNELAAAYLWPQLEQLESITAARRRSWQRYHDAFAAAERAGLVRRLRVPAGCRHNGHVFGLLLTSAHERARVQQAVQDRGVAATFHYVPLHTAPAGRRYGLTRGPLTCTEELHGRLLRLPLFNDIDDEDVDYVTGVLLEELGSVMAAA